MRRFSVGWKDGIIRIVATLPLRISPRGSMSVASVTNIRVLRTRFSRIRGRLHCGETGEWRMKIGEEVVHSSRRSSKSYLCTESGQPQAQERPEAASRLSLGAAPHPRSRRPHCAVAPPRARRRAGLRRYLAQHPRRSQADQIGSIVEPQRDGLAGHRALSAGAQAIEIPKNSKASAGPETRLSP